LDYNGAEKISVPKGQSILLPAIFKNVKLIPKNEAEILEVYIS